MNDIAFPEPVILQLPGIGERKIANSFEAIECLVREWPEWARERGWRKAYITCRDALDGWQSATVARRRLVKAARRFGLMPNSTPARMDAGAGVPADGNAATHDAPFEWPDRAIVPPRVYSNAADRV